VRILVVPGRGHVRSSLWFLPALFVLGSIALWGVAGAVDRHRLSSPARRNTASSISSVTFPVNVFCWLGW
jgi:hypothetical protein